MFSSTGKHRDQTFSPGWKYIRVEDMKNLKHQKVSRSSKDQDILSPGQYTLDRAKKIMSCEKVPNLSPRTGKALFLWGAFWLNWRYLKWIAGQVGWMKRDYPLSILRLLNPKLALYTYMKQPNINKSSLTCKGEEALFWTCHNFWTLFKDKPHQE